MATLGVHMRGVIIHSASDQIRLNVNGIMHTFNLGNVIAYICRLGAQDSYGNGEWGELDSPEVIPRRISLSTNLGTPSITAEVNVGWSAKTWGYPEGGGWGDLFDVTQFLLTGFGLSNTLGEETVSWRN
jgi:hypothetical protein